MWFVGFIALYVRMYKYSNLQFKIDTNVYKIQHAYKHSTVVYIYIHTHNTYETEREIATAQKLVFVRLCNQNDIQSLK